jgi:hypothetical protein
MTRYLKRTGASFRDARPARRPVLDQTECNDFLFSFDLSLEVRGRSAVVNFVMTGRPTVAERSSETVEHFVNGDVKAGFTFFASITADGTKLSLIWIVKDQSQNAGNNWDCAFPHDVWHRSTGWCKEELVVADLHWLRKHVTANTTCLVLDRFDAHDTPAVLHFPIRPVIHEVALLSLLTFLHTEQMLKISILQKLVKYRLSQKNTTLLVSPYWIQSSVSLSILREFISALEGNVIKIMDTNLTELK